MSKLSDWMHDDITWCMFYECPHTECDRNFTNRRTKGGLYSAADFRGTDECLFKTEETEPAE